MLALYLAKAGHQVWIEHDAYRALELARQERPDVYLLDIGLPGMDGSDMARHLRSMPETAHALVVVVSGYGQDADRQRAMEAGFDEYLVKPADPARLAALLASA